jgi:hypothetical protein
MFFQLIAEAASLTVTTRGGHSYTFTKGKPLKVVDKFDIEEFRRREDLAECSEQGLETRAARKPEPKSVTTFSGPSTEPKPKPAPHDPTPKEIEEARKKLEGST